MKEVYEVRKISKKEKNEDGEWMYLTEWKFYDDITWETADTVIEGGCQGCFEPFQQEVVS